MHSSKLTFNILSTADNKLLIRVADTVRELHPIVTFTHAVTGSHAFTKGAWVTVRRAGKFSSILAVDEVTEAGTQVRFSVLFSVDPVSARELPYPFNGRNHINGNAPVFSVTDEHPFAHVFCGTAAILEHLCLGKLVDA